MVYIFLLSLVSTQQCPWHSAVLVRLMYSNLAQVKWRSSLLKTEAQRKPLNLIGGTLLILFRSLDGANGLVQPYFFGVGFISIVAMQFLWVSLFHDQSLADGNITSLKKKKESKLIAYFSGRICQKRYACSYIMTRVRF